MRIALDPVPIVLGIYAYVGELLTRASARKEEDDAQGLGRRFARQRDQADREVQRLVRALHADTKIADKLLRKTSDIWKISQETDLVNLVVQPRGDDAPDPQAYVLLKPGEIHELLRAIHAAASGAGENEDTLQQLERAWDAIEARPGEYLAFGFDPWEA